MRKTLAAASVLTACNPSYGAGPAGTVSDRSSAYFKSGGWRYRLTITTTDGRRQEFRVTRDDYKRCFRGSVYPTCTSR
ncbi:hypothetical protein [Streptomyces sp. NPDC060027]|uniref:hypothetical protein n=1 Tax=Streptomyces sp. NPDC060027 TaxID=3347040 RepID=UPI0036813089